MKPQMHLAFDLSWTHLDGRWRMPGSWSGATYPDVGMYEEMARIAERGCLDMLFFGDGTGIPSTWRSSRDAAVRWGIGWPRQDMSPWIAAMARATQRIGFGLTYSSTFMHPFYVARLMNSLDHVTGGRVAFNVVTSTRKADAANYGFDELMEHDMRYERMEEFIDVCKKLWVSVGRDAFKWDRETGVVADPEQVKSIDHVGRFFRVRGPLNTVPSPQGEPILVQAGGSPRGIQASAYFADLVFGGAKVLDRQLRHRQALDRALSDRGRNPADVGILWDTLLSVAETEAEAKRRREQLLSAIPGEAVGAFLSHNAGYDFSALPARFSPHKLNEAIIVTQASPVGFVHRLAEELGPSAEIDRKEFFERGLLDATGYSQTFAGTAAQVADHMEDTFDATGSRGGFMIAHPQSTPLDLLNVVDLLVPELQRRGRFRKVYQGRLLRENLLN